MGLFRLTGLENVILRNAEEGEWGTSYVFKAPGEVVEKKVKPLTTYELMDTVSDKFSSPLKEMRSSMIKKKIEDSYMKKSSHARSKLDTESQEKMNSERLQIFPAMLLASVLEDIIFEYRIFVSCNTELRIEKVKLDYKELTLEKFGVQRLDTFNPMDDIDPKKLLHDEYKIVKLEDDRNLVSEVVLATYSELVQRQTYAALLNTVHDRVKYEHYITYIGTENEKNKCIRQEMNKQYRLQRNQHKSFLYDSDCLIDKLKNDLEDVALVEQARVRYTMHWQDARKEQNDQVIATSENVYFSSIEEHKAKFDLEQMAHLELESYTNIVISEMLEKVDYWMTRYEKDIEQIDLEIQRRKNEYMDMREKRIQLQNKYVKHIRQMKEWEEFKEAREVQLQYERDMTRCAVVVQAWWRGLLVRKQLGPFRKHKRLQRGQKKK